MVVRATLFNKNGVGCVTFVGPRHPPSYCKHKNRGYPDFKDNKKIKYLKVNKSNVKYLKRRLNWVKYVPP